MHGFLTSLKRLASISFQTFNHCFLDWTKPASPSLIWSSLTDFPRSKSELVAENALLRQQLIILRRQVKGPCAGYMRHPFTESWFDNNSRALQRPFFERIDVASTAYLLNR